ncbi:MAG TPA: protein kinase [Longilinea sp.]|nr:protein kinase [Longilinea sp.]
MTLEPGSILHNRYRIDEIIAKGGMGAIYRAVDLSLNVTIALKENLFSSEEFARQFRREASILAGLRHPNLPRVTDHFSIPGQGQYLIMDFIDGEDLRQWLEQGKVSQDDAVQIGIAICSALDYLHTLPTPILHRDIKPGNIKITQDGRAYLVDFGLAKIVQGDQATTTGAQSLTPGYAPPEQYGTGTDSRSDLYSLGATLYAALTGKIPEDGISRAMGTSSLTPIRRHNTKVSQEVAAVIERAMAVEPAKRYQTAAEFKQALLDCATGSIGNKVEKTATPNTVTGHKTEQYPKPQKTKRFPWWVGLLLGLVGIGILFMVLVILHIIPLGNFQSSTGTPGTNVTQAASVPEGTQPVAMVDQTNTPESDVTSVPVEITVTPQATPFSGGRGEIAYAGEDENGLPQIFIAQLVETNTPGLANIQQITNMPDGACQPSWEPGGMRLVFISPCARNQQNYPNAALYLINADGTNLRPLRTMPGGDFDPAWSPLGDQIAFTSLRDGLSHIFVYTLSDNSIMRISSSSNYDRNPAWSPDGSTLAIESSRLGTDTIFLVNPDGTDVREFTQLATGSATFPDWSADGQVIYFSRGSGESWLAAQGVEDSRREAYNLNTEFRPAVEVDSSYDGFWLVCTSNGDIYLLASNGSNINNLTQSRTTEFDAVWRPGN